MLTAQASPSTSTEDPPDPPLRPRRRSWAQALRRDWQLYSLAVLPLLFFVVFRYLPMLGNVIAFRRYEPGGDLFGEYWVGLRYFRMFLADPTFWQVFTNTAVIGTLTLLFCFPLPIVLALLLNEVRTRWLKGFVQTVSYLPHFLSIVVVAGLILQTVSIDGVVNQGLRAIGQDPVAFIQEPGWFRTIYVSSEVWQTVGWGTILYLAALTTIDNDLYDQAKVDGANRWRQTWHVTLPGIRPTMITLLILNIGTFLAVGFEKVLLLYNPLTYATADVVSTYLYRVGIVSGSFSYAAAIGLFESLIGLALVLGANSLSRRVAGTSLW
ncbi:ABC transporter permease [Actinoplanes xinjiangensis]|jgi:putative aldouronate transport system permease protein|uniref:Carbohydrate ABC transporter membrane protein 1 (CUT1 family) n=1 Tax=Actinoplanes xinjiangensis TaxID=512350 RepID=A0A316FI45_9ACTN|nr:ABC transporter permease subunit [Actinoplanes xinjiangensis]PWK47785.1 carbohydrate ABC transporter membrane protein 1 (CUT1 family) [Actinoplanes xinjiangensis]GIF39280.1 sugar ABC transporter permease [Actinoplanes xinjiangensis]